jgi:hypothetical protein
LDRRLLELVENSAWGEGGCNRVGGSGAALATRGESAESDAIGCRDTVGKLFVGSDCGRDAVVVRDEEDGEVAAGRIGVAGEGWDV